VSGRRSPYRKTKQVLGSCDDERFAIVPENLPPQQMEVLGRGSGESNVHVDGEIFRRIIAIIRELGYMRIIS